MAFGIKRAVKKVTSAGKTMSGSTGSTPGRTRGMLGRLMCTNIGAGIAGKAIGAKKGGMIKKKAASDMAGRALKRKTADAKGRAMKKGK